MTVLDDVKGWMHMVAMSPGVVLSDQVIQIVRVLAIAAVTWAAVEVVGMGRAMAVVQTQIADVHSKVSKMEAIAEARYSNQLTRQEFEKSMALLDSRLEAAEKRLDNHSRAMSAIVEGKRPKE